VPKAIPAVRACTRCQSTTNEFGKCSKVSDGKAATCKPCQREVFRLKYQSDPVRREQSKESSLRWTRANREKSTASAKRYQRANPESVKAYRQRYVAENRDKVYAKNSARSAAHRAASAPWADRGAMRSIYLLAKRMSADTGVAHVVDHVIPLMHPLVCGLHVETNLQVIPAQVNLSKSNSFIPF
jgi:hypothetical protein